VIFVESFIRLFSRACGGPGPSSGSARRPARGARTLHLPVPRGGGGEDEAADNLLARARRQLRHRCDLGFHPREGAAARRISRWSSVAGRREDEDGGASGTESGFAVGIDNILGPDLLTVCDPNRSMGLVSRSCC
jgi:hypothetical protein